MWEQFDKRPVPAAGAAPAPAAAAATTAAAAMEVKYACKNCPNVRSAHEARMKEQLLNIKVCGFLSSTAAAECPAEPIMDLFGPFQSLRNIVGLPSHLQS